MYPNHNSCPTTQQLADTVALPKQKAEVQHKMHDPRGKFDAALELQVLCDSVQVVVFSVQFSVLSVLQCVCCGEAPGHAFLASSPGSSWSPPHSIPYLQFLISLINLFLNWWWGQCLYPTFAIHTHQFNAKWGEHFFKQWNTELNWAAVWMSSKHWNSVNLYICTPLYTKS